MKIVGHGHCKGDRSERRNGSEAVEGSDRQGGEMGKRSRLFARHGLSQSKSVRKICRIVFNCAFDNLTTRNTFNISWIDEITCFQCCSCKTVIVHFAECIKTKTIYIS